MTRRRGGQNFVVDDISGETDDLSTYQKSLLENGITVVTERIPQARSISLGVLVDAGPRDESPEKNGLAHLCEHMMFQGTSGRSSMDIARFMDEAGGYVGGFTTRDYTCYAAAVLDEFSTYALDILGDILLYSTFPESSLGKEKEAILSEIASSRDMPRKRNLELLKELVWKDHALGRPIAGGPDTVVGLTREDVIYFVHQHYSPNRMVIAAAGNLRHEDILANVRDCFWRMLGTSTLEEINAPSFHSGTVWENADLSQSYFSVGIPALRYVDGDRYVLHVLAKVLGGGISSRLHRRLREQRGLVYDVSAEYHAYDQAGLLVIEGSTRPDRLSEVLAMILDELVRCLNGEEPVEDAELCRAKRQLRAQHLIGSEDPHTRMGRLLTQHYYFNRHLSEHEVVTELQNVDLDGLGDLSTKLLRESLPSLGLAVVGPDSGGAGIALEKQLSQFQDSLVSSASPAA